MREKLKTLNVRKDLHKLLIRDALNLIISEDGKILLSVAWYTMFIRMKMTTKDLHALKVLDGYSSNLSLVPTFSNVKSHN